MKPSFWTFVLLRATTMLAARAADPRYSRAEITRVLSAAPTALCAGAALVSMGEKGQKTVS